MGSPIQKVFESGVQKVKRSNEGERAGAKGMGKKGKGRAKQREVNGSFILKSKVMKEDKEKKDKVKARINKLEDLRERLAES